MTCKNRVVKLCCDVALLRSKSAFSNSVIHIKKECNIQIDINYTTQMHDEFWLTQKEQDKVLAGLINDLLQLRSNNHSTDTDLSYLIDDICTN